MADNTNLRVFAEQVYNGLPEYLQGDDSQSTINAIADMYGSFFDLAAPLFLNERNAIECTQESLDLLAKEGSLERLDTETIESFRLRVDEKFFNQIKSGTFSGFGRILQIFGIPEGKDAIELVSGSLWDFVFIAEDKIDQSIVPPDVLRQLAGAKYGRTGRVFNGILETPVFQYDLDASPDPVAGGYDLGKYLSFSFGS